MCEECTSESDGRAGPAGTPQNITIWASTVGDLELNEPSLNGRSIAGLRSG